MEEVCDTQRYKRYFGRRYDGAELRKKINWKTVKKDRLLGVLADSTRSSNACYTNEVCLVATWLSAMLVLIII